MMKQVKVILLVSKACYPVGGERNAYFARSESVLPEWRKKKYTLCFLFVLEACYSNGGESNRHFDRSKSVLPAGRDRYIFCLF